jgi:hypothetical protein
VQGPVLLPVPDWPAPMRSSQPLRSTDAATHCVFHALRESPLNNGNQAALTAFDRWQIPHTV